MTDAILLDGIDEPQHPTSRRRRPWLLSLGIGLICAIVAGLAVWAGIGERYTASAFLRVGIEESSILGHEQTPFDRERFEILKSAQQQTMTSRLVLAASLRKPEVAKMSTIQDEQKSGDAVEWLQMQLSVSFPLQADYMQVSVTRPDPQEAATLVNAVVDSYWTEVVEAFRRQKQANLSKVESACAEKENQIRETRKELKSLAAISGIGPGLEAMTQRQKLLIEEYSLRNQYKVRTEYELDELQGQLVAQDALLKNIDSTEPPAEEVEMLMRADSVTNQMLAELATKKQEEAVMNKAATSSGSKHRDVERHSRELQAIQALCAEKLAEAKKKVQERRRMMVLSEATKLRSQFEVKRAMYEKLARDVEKLKEEASRFGGTTVDIEMRNSELKQLEQIAQELSSEREKMRVELDSAPRITLTERAEKPLVPSNFEARLGIAFVTMMIVFFGTAIFVILCDALARRVNRTN